MAVAVAGSYSSNSTPSLEPPCAMAVALKKKKKKKKATTYSYSSFPPLWQAAGGCTPGFLLAAAKNEHLAFFFYVKGFLAHQTRTSGKSRTGHRELQSSK